MTNRSQQEEVLALLAEIEHRKKYSTLEYAFLDEGPFARNKYYGQSLKLFKAGKKYHERAYVAPNRCGKTYSAAYETTLHLTGLYPDWWEGHRFTKPISAWLCADRAETARDTIQMTLLGPRYDEGTGLIPKRLFAREPTNKPGNIPGARLDIFITHHDVNGVPDGISHATFKAYEARASAFMGSAQDWIWLDEAPPADIYTECLTRTATTKGHLICTFTPLAGSKEIFEKFVPEYRIPIDGIEAAYTYTVGNDWSNHMPHFSDNDKARLKASYAPWEMQARTTGIMSLGAGAVFPIAESEVLCEPFNIPDYFPKFAGLDVGWKKTAAVWCAYDPSTDTIYVYGEYYRGYAEPSIHADAIKARGAWIPIAIDPASNTPNQKDGDKLFVEYAHYGLRLKKADNSVTAGIMDMFQRFSTGRLKIFSSCASLITEFRCYQYDGEGRIRKQNDHALDALRYAVRTGFYIKQVVEDPDDHTPGVDFTNRDNITGY